MYHCEICNRETFKKIRYGGYTLCSKHMHQLQKYKRFLDSNPRSQNDLNEFRIDKEKEIAIFDLYDKRQNKVNEFVIDLEDLEKVRYHKWRLSYGNIVTGNNTNKTPTVYLTHLLLNEDRTDYEHKIDHRDGNTLNNRKSNLRICTQGENTLNKHFMAKNKTGIIGVHEDKRRNNYAVEIRYQKQRYHLGNYRDLVEAAYARFIAQNELFKEFSNNENFKGLDFTSIESRRRKEIKDYVLRKIQRSRV